MTEALHQPRGARTEGKDSTDRSIHMQPDPLLCAELRQGRNRIDRTTHGRAGGGHHGDARPVLPLKQLEMVLQGCDEHASLCINRNATDSIGLKAHDPGSLIQRNMGLFADQNHSLGIMIQPHPVSCRHQCGEIAERATAGSNSAGPIGQLESSGEPAAELPFQLAQTR